MTDSDNRSLSESYGQKLGLQSVAFEITSDRPTSDPIASQAQLAGRVEKVLRDMFPDHMIRQLDPYDDPFEVLDTEVWR